MKALLASATSHAQRPVLAAGTPRSGLRQPCLDTLFGAILERAARRRGVPAVLQEDSDSDGEGGGGTAQQAGPAKPLMPAARLREARECAQRALEVEEEIYARVVTHKAPLIGARAANTGSVQVSSAAKAAIKVYRLAVLAKVREIRANKADDDRGAEKHQQQLEQERPKKKPSSPFDAALQNAVEAFLGCLSAASLQENGCPTLPPDASNDIGVRAEVRQKAVGAFYDTLFQRVWRGDPLVSAVEALRLERAVLDAVATQDAEPGTTRSKAYKTAIVGGHRALRDTAELRSSAEVAAHRDLVEQLRTRRQKMRVEIARTAREGGNKRAGGDVDDPRESKRGKFAAEPGYKCSIDELLLSPEQLAAFGYPTATHLAKLLSEGDVSTVDYSRRRSCRDVAAEKALHTCSRCGATFRYEFDSRSVFVPQPRRCPHHPGRRIFPRGTLGRDARESEFTCCGRRGEAPGCTFSDHVWGGSDETDSFEALVRDGVAFRLPWNRPESEPPTPTSRVFGVDCEMVYTLRGFELARVTCVDFDGEEVLDFLVKPAGRVVDYNTRFSGMTEESLADVTTTIEEAQMKLLHSPCFSAGSVLVGQSLESDLKAVRIIFERVADTSILFPHKRQASQLAQRRVAPNEPHGRLFRRSLRELSKEFLDRKIQDAASGHDSLEDALASLDLVKLKMMRGKNFGLHI
jgi:hypothetical protein